MFDNEVISRIAQKIKVKRLEKDLTLQELAIKSKVSKGLLSKIENSRTIPSLPVFVSIIQSLDLSLKEFFDDMILVNGKNFLHLKKSDYAPMEREGREGFNYLHIFSQALPNCTLEASLLTIEPGARAKPSTTDGYELKYILEGTCEYIIDRENILLEEGDTLYFDASIPHLPVNKSRKKVIMLVIYFLFSRFNN